MKRENGTFDRPFIIRSSQKFTKFIFPMVESPKFTTKTNKKGEGRIGWP